MIPFLAGHLLALLLGFALGTGVGGVLGVVAMAAMNYSRKDDRA